MPKFVTPSKLHGDNSLLQTVGGTAVRLTAFGGPIAIGNGALNAATAPPADTIAIGTSALSTLANGGGSGNIGIGNGALYTAGAAGNSCVAVGWQALTNCAVTGAVGIGYQAGTNVTAAGTFVGYQTGGNAAGTGTTVLGFQAGKALGTGAANTLIGHLAGTAITGSASTNTAVGYQAGSAITSGSSNALLGYNAGQAITTGANNVVIGASSTGPTTGNQNTMVGSGASASGATVNALALGFNAVATGNGAVAIGTDSGNNGANTSVLNEFKFGTTNHLYNFPGSVSATLKFAEGANVSLGTTTGTKIGTLATHKLGFWNVTPVVQNTGWSITAGYSVTKALSPTSTTLNAVAAMLGTLVDTLKTYGLLG
jgi:hypothetical protein